MIKTTIILLLLSVSLFAAPIVKHYVIDPNNTKVESINYDKELHMLVIKVYAEVFWFKVTETYGLKVVDDSNIDIDWKRIVGDKPIVIHLKEVGQ